ncbi:aminopeptidase P II [Plesiocystis pacifica SIR-1]|uniref:Xaa-Pro aminopeptidase n=1 Tax=Plesiocystis pacifica SIR-1 TaxID=391625 RepID=A6GJZ9_9BACT|nr:aminopeptidase P N-terminal domain-containing protein [Plesiocystis pacifica]EDM73800.1 aminopeptidase P II [Plesiocystis pacifica SIR-1]
MSDATHDPRPGPWPSPSLEAYLERRSRVAASLRERDAALVLYGGELRTRANDTEFRFRPDSDFHYLCGLEEPGAVVVLLPEGDGGHRFVAFVRPRDREIEVWSGRRLGPEGVVERFGADEAHPLAELDAQLPRLLDGYDTVFLPLGRWPALDAAVHRALTSLRRHNRTGESPPRHLGNAEDLLGEERIVKDAASLASLRQAVDITAEGHLAAMRAARPGMHEYQIEALIEYEFRRRGSSGPGYGSIVGSGDNATILHYVDNRSPLGDGEVLLIDAGAEWDYHSGDITRSWPVNGRFTPEQRDAYEVVLAANLAGIELAKPGSNIDAIHERCLDVLCEGMASLKLIPESAETIRERKLYRKFYMHRTSHWLGVDVHDAGRYTLGGEPRAFAPGHVLTVEPGLYIAADTEDVPEGFCGLGIRVEDDILITADGHEVLSAKVPKRVDAMEAIIGEAHR